MLDRITFYEIFIDPLNLSGVPRQGDPYPVPMDASKADADAIPVRSSAVRIQIDDSAGDAAVRPIAVDYEATK
jgi:hypothetical protein